MWHTPTWRCRPFPALAVSPLKALIAASTRRWLVGPHLHGPSSGATRSTACGFAFRVSRLRVIFFWSVRSCLSSPPISYLNGPRCLGLHYLIFTFHRFFFYFSLPWSLASRSPTPASYWLLPGPCCPFVASHLLASPHLKVSQLYPNTME